MRIPMPAGARQVKIGRSGSELRSSEPGETEETTRKAQIKRDVILELLSTVSSKLLSTLRFH